MTRRGTRWIREDLLPQYVLLYIDGKYITENQHPWYKDRAYMYDNGSMYILDPEPKDTGLYIRQLVYEYGNNNMMYIEHDKVNLTV